MTLPRDRRATATSLEQTKAMQCHADETSRLKGVFATQAARRRLAYSARPYGAL